MTRKIQPPLPKLSISALTERVKAVENLTAAAERMGAADSVKVLSAVQTDLKHLLRQEREKHAYASVGGANPEKWSPELGKQLTTIMHDGQPLAIAAELVGVARNTADRWLREGKAEPDGKYGQFARDVLCARASRTSKMVSRAHELAELGDSHLLRWLIERWEPECFAAPTRLEVTGADGGPIKIDVSELSEDELRRIVSSQSSGGAGAAPKGPRS